MDADDVGAVVDERERERERNEMNEALREDVRLSYCNTCVGRGRVKCTACDGAGIENRWLYGPAKDGGWGARGEWRDPANPPPPPPRTPERRDDRDR